MPRPRTAIRTCLGCRQRLPQDQLVRFIAAPGDHPAGGRTELAFDPRGTLPGRGAWLHPDQQCLRKALKRRAFPRALRVNDLVVAEDIAEHVRNTTMKAGSEPMDIK